MATLKKVTIKNYLPKTTFSGHPGHGNASKTAAQFAKLIQEAASTRLDHNAKARNNYP